MSDNFPPIKIDVPHQCPKCNAITLHECTIYVDIEYRVCKKCRHRSTWIPEGKTLQKIAETDPDKTKRDYDDKRRFPHRKNRTKKTDEEEEGDSTS